MPDWDDIETAPRPGLPATFARGVLAEIPAGGGLGGGEQAIFHSRCWKTRGSLGALTLLIVGVGAAHAWLRIRVV